MKKFDALLLVSLLLSGWACTTTAQPGAELEPEEAQAEPEAEPEEAQAEPEATALSAELGCAETDQVVFHCNFDSQDRGVSICRSADSSTLTVTTVTSEDESHRVEFSSKSSDQIYHCRYSSPHQSFTYTTFTDEDTVYRVDMSYVSDPKFVGTEDETEPAGLVKALYSFQVQSDELEDSTTIDCVGDVEDNLMDLYEFHDARVEEQIC